MIQISKPFFQSLPHFKGKLRLAKMYYKAPIQSKDEIEFPLVKYGLTFFVPNIIENVAFELLVMGIYEQETIDFFVKNIPQNGTFIDVGANIGAISVVVAKLRPDVTIHAFEASPFVFHYLKKNIENNNLKNVFCYNKAVHTDDNIQLPFYSPKDKNGKGSFSNVFTNDAVMVNTINLDNFFIQHNILPSAIKIDVEGYEKLIFQSMQNTLRKLDKTFILFEFVDWAENLAHGCEIGDAQKIIMEYGYKLVEMNGNKYSPKETVQYSGSCSAIVATKQDISSFEK